jgi:hypothetical protein
MRCNICEKKYNDFENISKVLINCGHSFCQKCLFNKCKCPNKNCMREIVGYITNHETLDFIKSFEKVSFYKILNFESY